MGKSCQPADEERGEKTATVLPEQNRESNEVTAIDLPNSDPRLESNEESEDAHAFALSGLDAGSESGQSSKEVSVIVSLGSNVEPRAEYLAKAREALSAMPGTRIEKESSVIETEPVDVPQEYAAMKFLNQVLLLSTRLDPFEFSRRMHEIEDRLGRVRTVRNGPRTIDIDLIDYAGITLDTPDLTLPHPRAKLRPFVMLPIRELSISF